MQSAHQLQSRYNTNSDHTHPLSCLLLVKSTLNHISKKTVAALISKFKWSNVLHFLWDRQWCHFRWFCARVNARWSRLLRCGLCAAAIFLHPVIQCGFTFLFSFIWESRVLPCSPSCLAELTHSSPGPMLPQSTTASLRTLEYNSAAEQGSRARADKKTG